MLPEAVTDDESRLADLQARFEEVLIQHGLLRPGEDDGKEKGEGVKQHIKSAIAL